MLYSYQIIMIFLLINHHKKLSDSIRGSTRNFTVSGLTLPVAMAYSVTTNVLALVPGIATSEAGAREFIERLVKLTVFDFLGSEARSALLPDAVISAALS
ncbi:hypothetical protein KIN20_030037 [Parelaphostrongylus tenuis]|uniref:Uncharacterized protein n=1 Tax=Parelaphostrongylus tenuis TaxID=148309 RepID=A0AAD5R3A4_PARTN|nr:hypothetical protein KIN20_030037 [Parelaphostrongylus tenuis]